MGQKIKWISIVLSCHRDRIDATIKDELLIDCKTMAQEALSSNTYSCKRLRTLVGKAVHVSSLLIFWRPFVKMLWAPLLAGHS